MIPAIPDLRGQIIPIDGLRGIAVLAVMAFHFTLFNDLPADGLMSWSWRLATSTGWIGVDLFFVLSGFLITGILCDSKAKQGYFRNFYARRILRIFPLYYLALVLLLIILPALFGPLGGAELQGKEQLWYWAYLSNVQIALHGWDSAPRFLQHFWSLAIEEQFYLFWPLVVFMFNRRALFVVCVSVVVLTLLLRIHLHANGASVAAYLLTPARMDGLAVGSALAVIVRDPVLYGHLRRGVRPAGIVLSLLLLAIFVWRRGLDRYDFVVGTIGFTLLACWFGAIVASALIARHVGSNAIALRVLSSRLLRFFGKYSYGLYVFHQPIAVLLSISGLSAALARLGADSFVGLITFAAVATALSVLAALLSWSLYEKHFLTLKDRFFSYSSPSTPRLLQTQP